MEAAAPAATGVALTAPRPFGSDSRGVSTRTAHFGAPFATVVGLVADVVALGVFAGGSQSALFGFFVLLVLVGIRVLFVHAFGSKASGGLFDLRIAHGFGDVGGLVVW